MREKHLLLRDNIGTFAQEDAAFDLLTRLNWLLPFFVIASGILDLVLAFVYLKWLHPWKIILQEVRVLAATLDSISKEPESWNSNNEQGQDNPVMEKVERLSNSFVISPTPPVENSSAAEPLQKSILEIFG